MIGAIPARPFSQVFVYIRCRVLNAVIFAPARPLDRFRAGVMVATRPLLVMGKKALSAKDLTELIAWLKTSPYTATLATCGAGGVSHVAGIFFSESDWHAA